MEFSPLKYNLALKGGTAINLTIFNLPRLSVDIDLDFTTNSSREEMMQKRQRIKELLVNYLEKNGYKLDKDTREHHALDSLKASYINAGGNPDTIKIEINYMLRAHVYEPVIVKTQDYGLIGEVEIRAINPIEIFGSKLVALMTRSTPRDLYDFLYMINANIFNEIEINKMKKCSYIQSTLFQYRYLFIYCSKWFHNYLINSKKPRSTRDPGVFHHSHDNTQMQFLQHSLCK